MAAGNEANIMTHIDDWLGLSRPPFHALGILPFCLGSFLAWRLGEGFQLSVFILGFMGIVMVMVATHHAGRYISQLQDERSKPSRNPFLGGPGRVADLLLRRPGPLRNCFAAISAALLIGLIMQFGLATGPWTLLLGCLGALPGFFYAARPIRPAGGGYGELLIAFVYGWLPIAAAFYIQQKAIDLCIHCMALPIGLAIFNVILLNEFMEQTAAPAVARMNLLRRLGKPKGAALYCLSSILSWLAFYSSLNAGIPRKALFIYLPVMVMSAGISVMMAGKRYENPLVLEILCGTNIAVYLGTTASLFLAFL